MSEDPDVHGKREGRVAREGEVTIDSEMFARVLNRAGLTERQLCIRLAVARTTIRRCLNIDGKDALINIEENALRTLVKAVSDTLQEQISPESFYVDLDSKRREILSWRRDIRRECLLLGKSRHLIAALDNPNTHEFLSSSDNAQLLYATLANNGWTNRYSEAKWACSWRQASTYVAHLRGKEEDRLQYYCSGNEGIADGAAMDLIVNTGWFDSTLYRIAVARSDVKYGMEFISWEFECSRKFLLNDWVESEK